MRRLLFYALLIILKIGILVLGDPDPRATADIYRRK